MGNNYVKELGVDTTTVVGTKEFNSIWKKYAETDDTITRKQATKFLSHFAEANKVKDWSKEKAEGLLDYVDPSGARKLTKEDFTALFFKTAEEVHSRLSQSLLNVHDKSSPSTATTSSSTTAASETNKKEKENDEYVEPTGPVLHFVEKREKRSTWVAPPPQTITKTDFEVDPKRRWIYEHGIASSHWTKPDFLLAPYVDVRDDKQKEAIDLYYMLIRAEISGLVSRVTIEMTFFNHANRDLEGELQFPLPDGATIVGYGLDVNGVLVAASLVEKQRARQIFEQEVKKNVDPGLVEVVKGNQFRTRIYPLPAHGKRTVSITYVTQLETRDDAPGMLIWKHPLLLFKSVVLDLQVAVVHDSGKMPVFVSKDLSDMKFKESDYTAGTSYYSSNNRCNEYCSTSRAIEIHVPFDETKPRLFLEKSHIDNEYYFTVQDLIPEYKAAGNSNSCSSIDRVVVFWDSSLSRDGIDKKRELDILAKFISNLNSNSVIEIVPFHYRQEDSTSFSAKETKQIIQFLTDLPLDGCTRFDNLHLPHPDKKVDLCIVFTDGMGSVGDDLPEGVEKFPPTFIIGGNSPATNHLVLRFWSNQTGGLYFDLSKIKDNDTIVGQIGTSSNLSIVGISAENDGDITEVYPRGAVSLASKGKFVTITGKLRTKSTTLKINYGLSKHNIIATTSHRLQQQDEFSSGLVAIIWAQQRLEFLCTMEEKNKDEIIALGRKFGIVTPGTSLLVLETLEQHLEHKVEPHPSRTEIYTQYRNAITRQEQEEDAKISAKLARVKGWWRERVDWWNTDFNYQPEPPRQEKQKRSMDRRERRVEACGEMRENESSAPMMMMMMSSSLANEAEKCEEADEDCEEDDIGGALDSLPDDSVGGKISVKYWDPKTPYLEAIKNAKKEQQYSVYLKQRASYRDTAAFYFDCAHHFYHHHGKELGTRILTNIVELKLESHQLLRVAGYKLDERGEWQLASELFSKVLKLRPDEPQSYRDLALVLEKLGQYQKAADLLWTVISGPNWSPAYAEIEVTALYELNELLEKAQGYQNYYRRLGVNPKTLPKTHKRFMIELPKSAQDFVHNIDVDLRISMAWDTDGTDMDLHVREPSGEEAYYGNKRTKIGGLNSRDFTGGYGPEEYMVKKAYPGTYVVKTNYFSSSQATLTGPTTILLSLFTNYGRPNQECQQSTIRLQESKDNCEIGSITIDPSKWNKSS